MINSDEMLFVVDEENNPLEPKPRKDVHKNGYWHRTAHIWIINHQKQILCQRRSLLKDTSPGKWEAFFGGHMSPGEKYIDSAQHELEEELGIVATKESLHLLQVFKCVPATEFQGIHYLEWDGNIDTLRLEKDEVDQVNWFPIDELYEKLVINQSNNWTIFGYEKEVLEHLKDLK